MKHNTAEEQEAAAKYGDGIVRRVTTRCDVSSIRAVQSKLRAVAKRAEEDLHGDVRQALLHDIWKAMDWLPTSFPTGFRNLLKKEPKL